MGNEILVVDDKPEICLLLTELLENKGYGITTAENGKVALDKIYKKSFNLIILDYYLPILNGYEVIERLKYDKFTIPIILMTGLPEGINESKKNSLIIDTVAKPFNIQYISDLVKSIIA
ncbi:response regulator [Virgibacillus siamensis]|uniref:response regulator n=1 Tax=Virgibacillus siamensis TaxID=480071 RepID=UPI000986E6D5|nr:response regulator [Virgibacillus siamensis]